MTVIPTVNGALRAVPQDSKRQHCYYWLEHLEETTRLVEKFSNSDYNERPPIKTGEKKLTKRKITVVIDLH